MMLYYLIAAVLSIQGWQSLSPNMHIVQETNAVHFEGQGSCYLDLTGQITAPEINGITVILEGTGDLGIRLMMDTEGDTYIVAKTLELRGQQVQVHLAKAEKQLLALRATNKNMPERLRLYIDADQDVNLRIKGVETW